MNRLRRLHRETTELLEKMMDLAVARRTKSLPARRGNQRLQRLSNRHPGAFPLLGKTEFLGNLRHLAIARRMKSLPAKRVKHLHRPLNRDRGTLTLLGLHPGTFKLLWNMREVAIAPRLTSLVAGRRQPMNWLWNLHPETFLI